MCACEDLHMTFALALGASETGNCPMPGSGWEGRRAGRPWGLCPTGHHTAAGRHDPILTMMQTDFKVTVLTKKPTLQKKVYNPGCIVLLVTASSQHTRAASSSPGQGTCKNQPVECINEQNNKSMSISPLPFPPSILPFLSLSLSLKVNLKKVCTV